MQSPNVQLTNEEIISIVGRYTMNNEALVKINRRLSEENEVLKKENEALKMDLDNLKSKFDDMIKKGM